MCALRAFSFADSVHMDNCSMSKSADYALIQWLSLFNTIVSVITLHCFSFLLVYSTYAYKYAFSDCAHVEHMYCIFICVYRGTKPGRAAAPTTPSPKDWVATSTLTCSASPRRCELNCKIGLSPYLGGQMYSSFWRGLWGVVNEAIDWLDLLQRSLWPLISHFSPSHFHSRLSFYTYTALADQPAPQDQFPSGRRLWLRRAVRTRSCNQTRAGADWIHTNVYCTSNKCALLV